jgi:hypothetical protein
MPRRPDFSHILLHDRQNRHDLLADADRRHRAFRISESRGEGTRKEAEAGTLLQCRFAPEMTGVDVNRTYQTRPSALTWESGPSCNHFCTAYLIDFRDINSSGENPDSRALPKCQFELSRPR